MDEGQLLVIGRQPSLARRVSESRIGVFFYRGQGRKTLAIDPGRISPHTSRLTSWQPGEDREPVNPKLRGPVSLVSGELQGWGSWRFCRSKASKKRVISDLVFLYKESKL